MTIKPTVMITFREGGENGGPYNSHKRIMESSLSNQYHFIPLIIPKGRIGIFNLSLIKKLRQDIVKVNPDIVHFGGLQLEGFHVAVACRLAGVRNIILAIHGSSLEAIGFPRWKKALLNILEIATIKMSKLCYGVSEYVSQWSRVKSNLHKYYGHIYNIPEITESQLEIDKKETTRSKLGLSQQDVVVVSTGRITREKGFEILLNAIKIIKTDINVKFLIVGNGEYYQEMKSEIELLGLEEKIIMLGYRNDIEEILSVSDIFVICSLHETLCMSLLEAGQKSLPLVATDVGGIPEIIVNNFNGFLTPKNDINSVKKALEKLIEDNELRTVMGERSKKIIEEKFNKNKIVEQLNSMYRSLLK